MAVTIQMIETKEFKLKPQGYDPVEVDHFLDDIADEMEEMIREMNALRQQAARPQAAPAPVYQPAPAPVQDVSEAAQKILTSAQRVSDETMADARKQADLMLADARNKAERLVEDARKEATRLKDSMDTLRSAANDYRARFTQLLQDQMHVINAETELFK